MLEPGKEKILSRLFYFLKLGRFAEEKGIEEYKKLYTTAERMRRSGLVQCWRLLVGALCFRVNCFCLGLVEKVLAGFGLERRGSDAAHAADFHGRRRYLVQAVHCPAARFVRRRFLFET